MQTVGLLIDGKVSQKREAKRPAKAKEPTKRPAKAKEPTKSEADETAKTEEVEAEAKAEKTEAGKEDAV